MPTLLLELVTCTFCTVVTAGVPPAMLWELVYHLHAVVLMYKQTAVGYSVPIHCCRICNTACTAVGVSVPSTLLQKLVYHPHSCLSWCTVTADGAVVPSEQLHCCWICTDTVIHSALRVDKSLYIAVGTEC